MVTLAERNARLDTLKTSVDRWAELELRRIENEAKFIDAVLQGRGARKVGTANLMELLPTMELELSAYLKVG